MPAPANADISEGGIGVLVIGLHRIAANAARVAFPGRTVHRRIAPRQCFLSALSVHTHVFMFLLAIVACAVQTSSGVYGAR